MNIKINFYDIILVLNVLSQTNLVLVLIIELRYVPVTPYCRNPWHYRLRN